MEPTDPSAQRRAANLYLRLMTMFIAVIARRHDDRSSRWIQPATVRAVVPSARVCHVERI
jgi:hypothetical protein